MKQYRVNIIILNYEGRQMLEQYLPSIVQAASRSRHRCVVTVLDNCSTDKSVEYVRSNFSSVIVIEAPENLVLCSYNEVAARLDDDILILLNNDLSVDVDFVDPMVEIFERHEDAFFVSPYGDRSIGYMRWGTITADIVFKDHEKLLNDTGFSFNTGMGAFDRKKFLELGGYDPIYLPGRYEDVDLCFRGWKRGWKGYCQPKSRFYHEGGTSFKKAFSEKGNERLVFRNSIFFMMKNITDLNVFLIFIFFLMIRLFGFAVRLRWHMIMGFVEVLQRLPEVFEARNKVVGMFRLSDQEVLRINSRKAALSGFLPASVSKSVQTKEHT